MAWWPFVTAQPPRTLYLHEIMAQEGLSNPSFGILLGTAELFSDSGVGPASTGPLMTSSISTLKTKGLP